MQSAVERPPLDGARCPFRWTLRSLWKRSAGITLRCWRGVRVQAGGMSVNVDGRRTIGALTQNRAWPKR